MLKQIVNTHLHSFTNYMGVYRKGRWWEGRFLKLDVSRIEDTIITGNQRREVHKIFLSISRKATANKTEITYIFNNLYN